MINIVEFESNKILVILETSNSVHILSILSHLMLKLILTLHLDQLVADLGPSQVRVINSRRFSMLSRMLARLTLFSLNTVLRSARPTSLCSPAQHP